MKSVGLLCQPTNQTGGEDRRESYRRDALLRALHVVDGAALRLGLAHRSARMVDMPPPDVGGPNFACGS
jgi:hypothetical protein